MKNLFRLVINFGLSSLISTPTFAQPPSSLSVCGAALSEVGALKHTGIDAVTNTDPSQPTQGLEASRVSGRNEEIVRKSDYFPVGNDVMMFYDFQTHGEFKAANGDRPVALLVHGAAANSQTYGGLAQSLFNTNFDVLRVDLANHGKTLLKSGVHTNNFSTTGEQITRILQHLGVRNVVIYGHSMGGAAAVTSAVRFMAQGGNVKTVFLDDPYAMPLEDFYAKNQDLMVSSKVCDAFKTVGKVGMAIGALACFTPAAFFGGPQMTFALAAGAWTVGKIGDFLTTIMTEIALPIIKEKAPNIVAKRIRENESLYLVDGKLPASADEMGRATYAAYEPLNMINIAPQLGNTPVFILLGKETPQVPRRLMEEYERALRNGRIVELERLGPARPHLHPIDSPNAVARVIESRSR